MNSLILSLQNALSIAEIKNALEMAFDQNIKLAAQNDFECIKYRKKIGAHDYYIVTVNYNKFNNENIDQIGFVSFAINNRYFMRNRKFDGYKNLVDLIIASIDRLHERID